MTTPALPLSVAVVTDAISPYHQGGKEARYAQLLPRLNGPTTVVVYTMHWWPERSTRTKIGGVDFVAICPLISLYTKRRRSILQSVVFALSCFRLLTRPFDVVEADHMPYLQLFTLRVVTLLRRKPLAVTWNEVWGPEYWQHYLGRLLGRVAWWIERSAMRLPDTILAVSPGTADRLRSYLGNGAAIAVVENTIDLEFIESVRQASAEESGDVLYVGRLLKHKGVDLLIEAASRLNDAGPLRVLVVGRGPERAKLEQQAIKAGLSDVVSFRSDVLADADVFALMKAAKVFALPSVREGFGLAALEALACGTPVVTTTHPDNLARHLVGRSNKGFLIEPTAESLAEGIRLALALTPRQPREAESWLWAYDCREMANSYRRVLTCLCEGSRPA